jgi:hypothetical protein
MLGGLHQDLRKAVAVEGKLSGVVAVLRKSFVFYEDLRKIVLARRIDDTVPLRTG